MQSAKRIEPVGPIENLGEQAGYRSRQRQIPRLKSFDARMEKREPLRFRSTLPTWMSRVFANAPSRKTSAPRCSRAHQTITATRRSAAAYPLLGEFPKHAQVVYCVPQQEGGYCFGHKDSKTLLKWHDKPLRSEAFGPR